MGFSGFPHRPFQSKQWAFGVKSKLLASCFGDGVAIWTNITESDDGPRQYRTITIATRRYQDKETGEWKDAGGFAPSDLPALIFALQKVQEYVFTKPLPGQDSTYDSQSDEQPF